MASDLEFRIGAELTEIKGALAGLRNDFQKVGQQAQQAGGNNAFRGLEASVGRAANALKGLVAGFVSLAAAIKLIGAADEINTLNARLRIATGSVEEFNRAQVALFELAQRTRSSLGETINLYSRIAQATKDAGVGQETLLQVVETINQAVQLSGASTQAAEAALVQLGQGLASGTLRGEELNSILEQTPALADAIAKGLGITRGELRKYGEEGKLTAQEVLRALQNQREVIAQQFQQLPLTVGQAVTQLRNAGQQLIGIFDSATGATGGLASVIKDLADFLSSDAVIGAVIEFAATWSNAFRLIVTDTQEAVRIISEATRGITADGGNLFDFLGRAFRELPLNVRAGIQIATVNIAAFVDSTIASFGALADYIRAIFDPNTTIEQVRASALRTQAAIEEARQASVDEALRERQVAINEAARARQQAEDTRRRARQQSNRTGQGTFRNRPSDAQQREAEALRKAQLDAEEKALQASSQRALAILQENYEDRLIGARTYFEAKRALELQAIDEEIRIAQRRAQGGTPADREKALAEVRLLEGRKLDIQRESQRAQVAAERETQQQLNDLRAQDLENQGRTAEAAAIRLQAQFRDLRERLLADGNTAGVALIDRLIDAGAAKARFDEIKAQFDRVISDLQRRQQQIADQVTTGAISPAIATQEQSQARQQAEAELARLNAQLQELARNTTNPDIKRGAEEATEALRRLAIDGATGLDKAVMDLRAQMAQLQQNFAATAVGAGVDAINGLFNDLASGSKSAGDALKDFVRNFATSMAQIAARALATYAVLQLLDAVYPGLGKTVAAGMSVSAGVNHSGGMAGTGPRRRVDPLLFLGAPRFHSGGMVGLKPDERPAILQTGEEVLSRSDPRNQANGGGNGYRIVNVLDPSLVSGYLESSAGERSVLNVIGRNPAQVRQIIGA